MNPRESCGCFYHVALLTLIHSFLTGTHTPLSLLLKFLSISYLSPPLSTLSLVMVSWLFTTSKLLAVSMSLTYLSRSLIRSVVSMCSIGLVLSKKFRRCSLFIALSSDLDCMLLALSHHQSPRVSFVIFTRSFSLSPPIYALKLHTTSSCKYV